MSKHGKYYTEELQAAYSAGYAQGRKDQWEEQNLISDTAATDHINSLGV